MKNLPAPSRRDMLALALSPLLAGAVAAEPWRGADGTIRIEGSPQMVAVVRRWNRLFALAHPGEHLRALGTGSDSAVPLLTHGATLVAAMDRPIHPLERAAYQKINDARPLEIRVGHARALGDARTASSLAVYVSRSNPLDRISMRQLAGVLGQGGPDGDITAWSQLGAPGADAIHVYALPETDAIGGLILQSVLRGGDFAAEAGFVDSAGALLRHIAADPLAIGVAPAVAAPAGVKRIAITAPDGRLLHGTAAEIRSGAYPLARPLSLALRRRKGEPLDPLAIDYLRVVLSPPGQAALAAEYIPLTPQQAAAEWKKLA